MLVFFVPFSGCSYTVFLPCKYFILGVRRPELEADNILIKFRVEPLIASLLHFLHLKKIAPVYWWLFEDPLRSLEYTVLKDGIICGELLGRYAEETVCGLTRGTKWVSA
jgi:hypothetical protein